MLVVLWRCSNKLSGWGEGCPPVGLRERIVILVFRDFYLALRRMQWHVLTYAVVPTDILNNSGAQIHLPLESGIHLDTTDENTALHGWLRGSFDFVAAEGYTASCRSPLYKN